MGEEQWEKSNGRRAMVEEQWEKSNGRKGTEG
jgi:hypothetical protein